MAASKVEPDRGNPDIKWTFWSIKFGYLEGLQVAWICQATLDCLVVDTYSDGTRGSIFNNNLRL